MDTAMMGIPGTAHQACEAAYQVVSRHIGERVAETQQLITEEIAAAIRRVCGWSADPETRVNDEGGVRFAFTQDGRRYDVGIGLGEEIVGDLRP